MILSFDDDTLNVLEQWNDIELDEFPKSYPVILNISGKGVICKKTIDASAVQLKQLFPGLKISEFSTQYFNNTSNKWVAIARTSLIKEVLKDLEEKKLLTISVSLSSLSIIKLKDVLESPLNGVYLINDKDYLFDNGMLTQISSSNNGQYVQISEVNQEQVANFSNAISYLETQESPIEFPVLAFNKEELKYKQWLKLGIFAIPLFLLAVLFVNFVYSQAYSGQLSQLQTQYASSKASIQQLNKQKQTIDLFKQVKENSVISGISKSSFYIDRLISSKPNDISLSELNYHPVIKSKKNEYAFSKQQIKIQGTCPNNQGIINWISDLEKIEWVKSIEGPKLTSTKSSESSFFEIIVNYTYE